MPHSIIPTDGYDPSDDDEPRELDEARADALAKAHRISELAGEGAPHMFKIGDRVHVALAGDAHEATGILVGISGQSYEVDLDDGMELALARPGELTLIEASEAFGAADDEPIDLVPAGPERPSDNDLRNAADVLWTIHAQVMRAQRLLEGEEYTDGQGHRLSERLLEIRHHAICAAADVTDIARRRHVDGTEVRPDDPGTRA